MIQNSFIRSAYAKSKMDIFFITGPWWMQEQLEWTIPYELVHDKTYNTTSATSKDFDQPVHPHSLISLCWSHCAFYSLRAIQRGMNESPCHTGQIYRLIWVFAGHAGLIVDFVVCWLILCHNFWSNKIFLLDAIAPDKALFFNRKKIFFYFSIKMYVVGTH